MRILFLDLDTLRPDHLPMIFRERGQHIAELKRRHPREFAGPSP